MNGDDTIDEETIDSEVTDEEDVVEDTETTIVISDDDDEDDDADDYDMTGDINIEKLVADLESANGEDLARRRAARKRLEELREQFEDDDVFSSTYNFNLDEDLST